MKFEGSLLEKAKKTNYFSEIGKKVRDKTILGFQRLETHPNCGLQRVARLRTEGRGDLSG